MWLCVSPQGAKKRAGALFTIGAVGRCLSKALVQAKALTPKCRELVLIAAPKDSRVYLQYPESASALVTKIAELQRAAGGWSAGDRVAHLSLWQSGVVGGVGLYLVEQLPWARQVGMRMCRSAVEGPDRLSMPRPGMALFSWALLSRVDAPEPCS